MRKLLIAMVAAAALTIATAAQTQACSTHGYVRASTLNDLFHGSGGVGGNASDIEFEADNGGGINGQSDTGHNALNNAQLLANGSYDDGHKFGWKVKGQASPNWNETGLTGAQGQLEDIITTIERTISEQYDVAFTD